MARESAQTVAATQEEVEKVQVVTWEGVDPSVAERRVAHRGATYLAFTKPRIWVVFAVEAAAGAMLASPAPGLVSRGLVGAVGAVALAGAGAECLTNVIDRSIDARMQRTRNRPLPSGALDVAHATALGLVLVASSLVIGSWLGAVPLGLLLVGLFDNVIIYSALAKRATPWSIVLGAPSGAVAAWVGYSSVHLPLSPSVLLLGLFVMCWIPVHIWSLAWQYRVDYGRAGVPMAPVVWGPATFRFAWGCVVAIMIVAAIWFGAVAFSEVLFAVVGAGALLVGGLGLRWIASPSSQGARRVFGAVNAYLLLVLVVSMAAHA